MWNVIKGLLGKVVGGVSTGTSGGGLMLYVVIAVAVLSGSLSGYAVYKLEQGRIETLKAQVTMKDADIKVCRDVNKTNQDAIAKITEERDSNTKLCERRMATQGAVIRKLQSIDYLKGGINNETVTTGSGDDVLDALNGLFSGADR